MLPQSSSCFRRYPAAYSLALSTVGTPVVAFTVPVISHVSSVAGTSSVTFNVSAHGIANGYIHCALVKGGSPPPSLSSIKATGGSIPFAPASNFAGFLTIGGLDAVSSYDGYCYSEDNQDNPSALADTLNRKQAINTQCCRLVAFTKVLSWVYSDPSKHASPPVFQYELSSSPDAFLIVSPLFLLNGTITTDVYAIPASASFGSTASSTQLRGSFIIAGSATGSRKIYEIQLQIFGDSANAYSGDSRAVTVIPASDLVVPAPTLLYVKFADNGGAATAVFDSVVQQSKTDTGVWSCAQYFFFYKSVDTSCSWLNGTAVQISFSGALTSHVDLLTPGQKVSLLGDLLSSTCSVQYCKPQTAPAADVTALAPDNPVRPTIVLKVPTKVGDCQDVVVDASFSVGSGGRPWAAVQWAVYEEMTLAPAPDITELLLSHGDISRPVVLDSLLLNDTAYVFSLSLTNYLNVTVTSTATTTKTPVVSSSGAPSYGLSVSITGAAFRAIAVTDSLQLSAVVSFSKCALNKQVTYTWRVYKNYALVALPSNSTKNPNKYIQNPYAFSGGWTYIITVTATSLLYQTSDLAFVTVYIRPGALFASIAGGSYRVVPESAPFSLSASGSGDENYPQGTNVDKLLFSWSCTVTSTLGFGESCYFEVEPDSPYVVTVPVGSLTSNQTYTYTVVVTSVTNDGRAASANVIVKPQPVVWAALEFVSVFTVFTPTKKLTVSANITSNVSFSGTWSLMESSLALEGNADVLTSLSNDFPVSSPNTVVPYSIAVSPGVFLGGSSYTFQLSISSPDYDAPVFSRVTLRAASPPSSGVLQLFPSNGTGLVTTFLLATTRWTADASGYPLLYSFSYNASLLGPTLSLRADNEVPYVAAALPDGQESDNYVITAFAAVLDTFGASGVAQYQVVVTPPDTPVPTSTLLSYLLNNASNAFLLNDVDSVMQIINNVAASLSQPGISCSVNCSALQRSPCSSVANLCGACLSGLVDVSSASNSACVSVASSSSFAHMDAVSSLGVGQRCSAHSKDSCVYGLCTNGTCAVPPKSCPSATPWTPCSGNGVCSFYSSVTLTSVPQCLISDNTCVASCNCTSGYGGNNCNSTTKELHDRELVRGSIW